MIRQLKENEFDIVFNILENSFPKDEYRPYDEQKALLKNENYSIYVLDDYENKSIKAFITLWVLEDFVFIEHFAVNQSYRNQGIGSLILQDVKDMLKGQICLEVELPKNELTIRRITFYERNGFFYNDYPYIQPAISKGRQPIPLRIMTSGNYISRERFNKIKTIIYRDVYKFSENE